MKDLDAMDSMEKMLVQKAYQRQAPMVVWNYYHFVI